MCKFILVFFLTIGCITTQLSSQDLSLRFSVESALNTSDHYEQQKLANEPFVFMGLLLGVRQENFKPKSTKYRELKFRYYTEQVTSRGALLKDFLVGLDFVSGRRKVNKLGNFIDCFFSHGAGINYQKYVEEESPDAPASTMKEYSLTYSPYYNLEINPSERFYISLGIPIVRMSFGVDIITLDDLDLSDKLRKQGGFNFDMSFFQKSELGIGIRF